MQTDIVVTAAQPIERVEAADRGVSLENADWLLVVRQPDSGRQPRHARADDDRMVAHVRDAGRAGYFTMAIGMFGLSGLTSIVSREGTMTTSKSCIGTAPSNT